VREIMVSTERPRAASTAGAMVATWIGGSDVAHGTCSVVGCGRMDRRLTGWCESHYTRLLTFGDPLRTPIRSHVVGDVPTRFWPKADHRPNGCWVWTGAVNKGGYGVFAITPKVTRLAHRIAYELAVGAVPAGLQLDHLCRNRRCVNPAHLEKQSLALRTCAEPMPPPLGCGHDVPSDQPRQEPAHRSMATTAVSDG